MLPMVESNDVTGDAAYRQAIDVIHECAAREHLSPETVARMEFDLTVEYRLGRGCSERKGGELWVIQREIQEKHRALVASALSGHHTRASFKDALYLLLCEAPQRTLQILDSVEYEKYWGMKPGELPTREDLGIHTALLEWIPG